MSRRKSGQKPPEKRIKGFKEARKIGSDSQVVEGNLPRKIREIDLNSLVNEIRKPSRREK